MRKVKTRAESFQESPAKKALLEDQLGTLIQKMIVAKAPSCFIIPSVRSFVGQLIWQPDRFGKEVYLLG
jgi:hypothetical protein